MELSRLGGKTFPTLLSSQPITYSNISARVISFIDISDVQNLESELAVQQAALFQSEKLNALGTLLAGIAHELNNPLTVVVANAQNLARTTTDKGIREKLRKINIAADKCSKIVRSFLNAARKQEDETSDFDLGVCIEETLDLLAIGLTEDDVEISTEIEESLPPIKGNSNQISQVLMNLVLNAKQALQEVEEPKHISIVCHQSNDKKPGGAICVRQWPRYSRRESRQNFRAIFHNQTSRQGNWYGSIIGPWDHNVTRWNN